MDGVVQVQVVKQAARCRVPADQCAHVSRTKRKKGHVNVARARWAASVSVRNVGREKDGPAAGGRFLLYDEQQTVLREAPPLFKTASHRTRSRAYVVTGELSGLSGGAHLPVHLHLQAICELASAHMPASAPAMHAARVSTSASVSFVGSSTRPARAYRRSVRFDQPM